MSTSSVTHFVIVLDLPENQWQKAEIEGEQLVRSVIGLSRHADNLLDAINLNVKHLREIDNSMSPDYKEALQAQREMLSISNEKMTTWRQISRTGAHPYNRLNYFNRFIDVVVFFSTTDVSHQDLRNDLDTIFSDTCSYVYQEIIVPDNSVLTSPKVHNHKGRTEAAHATMARVYMRRYNDYRRSRSSR